ncbi:cyclic phosphodiesterase-like [Impatiens glandulifera]|uniref:cyclic phosphodiesterase-like n=1 Tax=Impatiens glandulifera TaxID=253017 RepID=UPI001FB100BD|nr:cyclic phosphodiesterase-like [Impatiens glandulifera]
MSMASDLDLEGVKQAYSVWALPPVEVEVRLKNLMENLRAEFGGPELEPHVTVVKSATLTEKAAREKFAAVCKDLNSYNLVVEKVDTGTCVFLLLRSDPQVMEISHAHFGHNTSFKPHMSLIYGDLTDEEMKKAEEKVFILEKSICSLAFQVSRLALYETPEDKTLKSWKKVTECYLHSA